MSYMYMQINVKQAYVYVQVCGSTPLCRLLRQCRHESVQTSPKTRYSSVGVDLTCGGSAFHSVAPTNDMLDLNMFICGFGTMQRPFMFPYLES